MVRRVKAYLGNIDDKLIEDEAKLQSLSEECEPPPNYIQKQTHAVQVPISIFDINTILVEVLRSGHIVSNLIFTLL